MLVKCIKGFFAEGGEFCIMKGEMFQLVEGNEDFTEFEGTQQSRFPGMLITFYEKQLCENFEFVA